MARNSQAPEGTSPGTELNQDSLAGGKGHATPTRKEKEAARKRPLVVNDRKERRRREAEATRVQREKQRIGMANGDPRFMSMRDQGPQKKYVRDYVDARTGISEALLPLIAVYFIASFFTAYPVIVTTATLGMYAVVLVIAADTIILGLTVRKKLIAKFGSAEKGVRLYAGFRAVYVRPLRLPKPQVKRGQFPV